MIINIRSVPLPTSPPSIASPNCSVPSEYAATHRCIPESVPMMGSFSDVELNYFTYEIKGPGCKQVRKTRLSFEILSRFRCS